MKNNSYKRKQIRWRLIDFGLPTVYFLLLYFFFPFRDAFWMDFDEGINLIKAQMLLRGFSLYSQIWSDQPPLLTYLLATEFRLFGIEASSGRILILVIVCGLIWAYLHYLRIVWGEIHAIAGFILLLLLPRFIDLSVSVMVGLPAIAFAFFSMLTLVYWHKYLKYHWLSVSAVALALSILTKLFTGFLIPIFLIGIFWGELSKCRGVKNIKKFISPGIIWGLTFFLITILLFILMVGPIHFDQLISNHLNASYLTNYRNNPNYWLNTQLINAIPILILALLGVVISIISRRWLALYPAVWMIISYMLMNQYVPVWNHQQLLITIPGALMAAAAVGEALNGFREILRSRHFFTVRSILYFIVLAIFINTLFVRTPIVASAFSPTPILKTARYKQTSREAKIMRRVLRYAPYSHWMITDIPMFAFYANIPIPPNLIVFSSKRLETGDLTVEHVIDSIEDYKPELVLLGRNKLPQIRSYLKNYYVLVRSEDEVELYVLKDVFAVEAGQSP